MHAASNVQPLPLYAQLSSGILPSLASSTSSLSTPVTAATNAAVAGILIDDTLHVEPPTPPASAIPTIDVSLLASALASSAFTVPPTTSGHLAPTMAAGNAAPGANGSWAPTNPFVNDDEDSVDVDSDDEHPFSMSFDGPVQATVSVMPDHTSLTQAFVARAQSRMFSSRPTYARTLTASDLNSSTELDASLFRPPVCKEEKDMCRTTCS